MSYNKYFCHNNLYKSLLLYEEIAFLNTLYNKSAILFFHLFLLSPMKVLSFHKELHHFFFYVLAYSKYDINQSLLLICQIFYRFCIFQKFHLYAILNVLFLTSKLSLKFYYLSYCHFYGGFLHWVREFCQEIVHKYSDVLASFYFQSLLIYNRLTFTYFNTNRRILSTVGALP